MASRKGGDVAKVADPVGSSLASAPKSWIAKSNRDVVLAQHRKARDEGVASPVGAQVIGS